ncbi:VWA domain-containing protein [Catenulispora sp. NF23]|uniref:VWA domain-containing protein n=1 Tax=Catenulispora pinistramenti TaxID=2705254 RepID=UPI001BAB8993|nr:VWA domain-containing protein [Catenulispora pinistramenti]MBS2535867.1 VWA domain-containing protein [Catenulispora pinistramenti]
MSQYPDFAFEINQNEYLAEGAREVHAVVTLTATSATGGAAASAYGAPAPGAGSERVEVIIIDCSGSMDYPRTKMMAAKEATKVAIDTLSDGTYFAVVAGTEGARVVYPTGGHLLRADYQSRAAAKDAVSRLHANGGTAMGRWLGQAGRIFDAHPNAIKHAILLTDGKDESETPADLARAIQASIGTFTADCRGIGEDWEVAEVRKIADALLGTVGIIREPERLAEDFREMTANSMGKEVADVALRLWTPKGAVVRFVKQVNPTLADLTGKRADGGNPLTGDYPTGAWGAESREYHICVEVEPGNLNTEKLAGRVTLVAKDSSGATALGEGKIRAIWTNEEEKTGRINGRVAHYTGQAEMASAIEEGAAAQEAGDLATATARLGRAMDLALESGREDTVKMLRKIAEVDPDTQRVLRAKSKSDVNKGDVMEAVLDSTKTVRTNKRTGSSGS